MTRAFSKMTRIVLLALGILTSCSNTLNRYVDTGEILTANGEKLAYYLTLKEKDKCGRKLLVFIQGSSRNPVKRHIGDAESVFQDFDCLYIEKFAINDERLYFESDCRERRTSDILQVTRHVIERNYHNDLSELLVASESEGGTISPEIALDLGCTTGLLILGSGGYTQSQELEELLQREFTSGAKGDFFKLGIRNSDDLEKKFEEIRKDPTASKFWFGHSHKRWNSYLWYSPESFISKLDIPTLIIMGERDENAPAESARSMIPKLQYKPNIKIVIIPDADHSFRDSNGRSLLGEIARTIIVPWYADHKRQD